MNSDSSADTRTKTVDDSSKAAIPGELNISRGRFVHYFGKNAVSRWSYRICSYLPWILVLLPWIGARVFQWFQAKEQLKYGCLNPAQVLDTERGLVAVFTDLANREGAHVPVVKIIPEQLDLISSSPVINGARFAAVAIYAATDASTAEGRWTDFMPIIVDCLVDDWAACENARTRIKPLAWKGLEFALAKLADKGKEGLFYVDVPDEIVADAW